MSLVELSRELPRSPSARATPPQKPAGSLSDTPDDRRSTRKVTGGT
ncbi:hypothetical protein STRTUCAR8_08396 [Streptomyces turgidiscabies Car8]|uniref:Uncharacterized protein n=1 Tax=Streptomyces turgidiscabies (strain Car8) TaxID=698760 RepID=L7F8V3_STRT8|nr:hypothetical protein STRTUCAR8_08396 [Streptomyces turgidiscabies Car8]